MPAERDEIVGACLGALVADDAGLCAGAGLGLEPQHAAEARRSRPPLGRILEREGRLRRVLQRDPQAFEQVDEEDGFEEPDDRLHNIGRPKGLHYIYTRSAFIVGSESPDMMVRSFRSTVPSLRILSCRRINPYSNASGRGGQPDT